MVGAPNGQGRSSEEGVIAIIVAVAMTAVLGVTALVVDIASARLDRQVSKSLADSAVMAGLQAADGRTADIFTRRGVCGTLAFLRANEPSLNGLPTGFCDASAMTSNVVCDENDPGAALSDYHGTVSQGGVTWSVRIKSPYLVTEGNFPEESRPTLASDGSDMNGCDQIAVIITKTRPAIFGEIAGIDDLSTTIRSVGRLGIGPSTSSPAMLLLKRTGCPVLLTGSTSGDSRIRVHGYITADGTSRPGTIHADTSGAGCSGGSNQNVFLGKAANGIVALAAPLPSNPSQADPAQPGMITSVAALNGHGAGVGYDSAAHVFGSASATESGVSTSSKTPPLGRSLVTRGGIDDRYFTGVRAIRQEAADIFTNVNATTPGWKVINGCTPDSAVISGLNLVTADRLYVNCTDSVGYRSAVPLPASTVVFAGKVNPSALLELPNATRVYVHGSSSDAIILSGGGGFSIHTAGNLDGATGLCSEATTTSTNKAVVVVKSGQLKQSTGGTLRACYATMLMMGGYLDACIPASEGTPPTQTPCNSASSRGNGQFSQTGGDVDWTAPNSIAVTLDAEGNELPAARPGWEDTNGPEDLAFWSESAGNNSNATYNMNGQGVLHTVGVYMVPNADSLSIGGGATQALTNAQYIATSIALNGSGTSISMRVDPNSAVTLPQLGPFTLVR